MSRNARFWAGGPSNHAPGKFPHRYLTSKGRLRKADFDLQHGLLFIWLGMTLICWRWTSLTRRVYGSQVNMSTDWVIYPRGLCGGVTGIGLGWNSWTAVFADRGLFAQLAKKERKKERWMARRDKSLDFAPFTNNPTQNPLATLFPCRVTIKLPINNNRLIPFFPYVYRLQHVLIDAHTNPILPTFHNTIMLPLCFASGLILLYEWRETWQLLVFHSCSYSSLWEKVICLWSGSLEST